MEEKLIAPKISEPILRNRFIVEFPEEFQIEAFLVTSLNSPIWENGQWKEIKINFVELINDSVSKKLMNIIDSIENSASPQFVFSIQLVDPTGTEIQKWIISVEKILSIDFGELNYLHDKLLSPSITVKPLNCQLI